MFRYSYHTVDVFTDRRFGGNPLAVFPDASGLDTSIMQSLAAELNYSETTFVLPPGDPQNTARVRIFNRTSELPFAGHPNIGTAFVLARLNRTADAWLSFEQLAGIVGVRLIGSGAAAKGAEIEAPQPLMVHGELAPADIAACLSLAPADLVLTSHPPVRASVGLEFVLVETGAGALAQARPDLGAFQRFVASRPDLAGRLSIFPYASAGCGSIRARMFAPLAGTWEDPATGSANAALAALRLSLSGKKTLAYEALQGVDMERESRLSLRAMRRKDGIYATIAGHCVSVFSGVIDL